MRTLIVALFIASPAMAQHAIRLRAVPDEGKSALVRLENKQEIDSTVKDADGKELKRDSRAFSDLAEYSLAVQEGKDGLPAKFSHEYSKAEETVGKETKALAWNGRKILFKTGKEKVSASVSEGSALKKEAIAELERIGATRFLDTVLPMIPTKELKAGEEWKVEPKDAASGLKVPFDAEKSSASGKLAKVYEKGGKKFGVIELKAELALKLPDGGKGKLEYVVKIDAAIDGTGTEGTYRAEVTISGEQTVQDKTKKFSLGGTTRSTVTMEVGEQK